MKIFFSYFHKIAIVFLLDSAEKNNNATVYRYITSLFYHL